MALIIDMPLKLFDVFCIVNLAVGFTRVELLDVGKDFLLFLYDSLSGRFIIVVLGTILNFGWFGRAFKGNIFGFSVDNIHYSVSFFLETIFGILLLADIYD